MALNSLGDIMTFEDLCCKYDIVVIDGHRFYNINLKERRYDLVNTAPFRFSYRDNFEIYSNSWSNMLIKLVKRLDVIDPKSKEEYLNFKVEWSKQSMFTNEKLTNFSFFHEKYLYINTNMTSLHYIWFIQDFLKFHSINMDECQLLIRRHHLSEPEDVKNFIIENNKTEFVNYLVRVYKFEKNYAAKICNTIDTINKNIIPLIGGVATTNLFLFDDNKLYSSAKSRVIQKIAEKYSEKNLDIAKMCLDYLTKFYFFQNKVKMDINSSV